MLERLAARLAKKPKPPKRGDPSMSLRSFLLVGEHSATDAEITRRIYDLSQRQLRDALEAAELAGDTRFTAEMEAALVARIAREGVAL